MAASTEMCAPLPAERLSSFGLASTLDTVCLRGKRRPILKAAMVLMVQEAEYVENACVHLTKRRRIGERKPPTESQQATPVPLAVENGGPQFSAIWDGAQLQVAALEVMSAVCAPEAASEVTRSTRPGMSSQQRSTAPASPRASSLDFQRASFESSSVGFPEIRGVSDDEVPQGEEIPAIPSPSSVASPVTTLQTAHSARRFANRLSNANHVTRSIENVNSPCEAAALPVFTFDLQSEADELLHAFSMIID
ncbi:MAG: hypothetical protein KVP17_004589 [Porospora cf. gigantea B]|uniref:uncharacterized protein n=1 Tax=Porospora cf. gigantea B TaxID=2853592 RepID=UPI0035717CDE|nr:MAG: hypothetical protein KVP17_004589 [Porospora cf. gigantea B]